MPASGGAASFGAEEKLSTPSSCWLFYILEASKKRYERLASSLEDGWCHLVPFAPTFGLLEYVPLYAISLHAIPLYGGGTGLASEASEASCQATIAQLLPQPCTPDRETATMEEYNIYINKIPYLCQFLARSLNALLHSYLILPELWNPWQDATLPGH